MVWTILSHPLFVEIILPFILVFVVIFAILQKTKILGDGKKQIDAMIALVMGLIVVSFSYATGIIISLIPFLAVGTVVILVFMLLYGMAFVEKDKKFDLPRWVRGSIGILAAVGVIIVTLIATGGWSYLVDLYEGSGDDSFWLTNAFVIALIVGAFFALTRGGSGGEGTKGK